jgi:small multidrug resistance pump
MANRTVPPKSPAAATPAWMRWVLKAAGLYNLAWGTSAVVAPNAVFEMMSMEPLRYPEIYQCLGMVIGLYGVGYWIASYNPIQHWAIVLVGLLGKLLGPLGFLVSALLGRLPWAFGITLVFNDLIWWVPFALILRHARAAAAEQTD